MTAPESRNETTVLSPLTDFPFTRDWLAKAPVARNLLPGYEAMISARRDELESGIWRPWSPEEIESVAQYNRAAGNQAGADLAKALAQGSTRVIVTGQQPDLLAAPLYVLHKALSAIAWSRKLSAQFDQHVIPVFWIASDDDDFAELKHAAIVNRLGITMDVGARISRGTDRAAGSPAFTWDLLESAQRLVEDISSGLEGWTHGPDTARWLADQVEAHSNFETFFARLLTSLLGPDNAMIFVAPRLLPFRQRQVQLLQSDIAGHAEVNTAVNAQGSELESAGYPVSLHRESADLNFFWIHDYIRHKLVMRDGTVAALDTRRNQVVWERKPAELADDIARSPQNYAPNVITRPILQDLALPALSYIAGPGEFAYLAMLGPAYARFGKSRAAVIPRSLVTIQTAGADVSVMSMTDTEAPDAVLLSGGENAVELLLQLRQLSTDMNSGIQAISETADPSPEIEKALVKTREHLAHGIEQLKRRMARLAAAEEWNRASRRASLLAPAGLPQERKLSPWNFVKAGEWHALAVHLQAAIDYTSTAPQVAPMPTWLQADL